MSNWSYHLNDRRVYQQPELDSIFSSPGAGFDNYIMPYQPNSIPLTVQSSILSENGGNYHTTDFSPDSMVGILSDLPTSHNVNGVYSLQLPDTSQGRYRMNYAQEQLEKLEAVYHTSERYGYPSKQVKHDLANSFGCSEAQINTWFSRRRGKDSQVKVKPDNAVVLEDSGANTPTSTPLNFVFNGEKSIISQPNEWLSYSSSMDSQVLENAISVNSTLTMMQIHEPMDRSNSLPHNECQSNNDWSSMVKMAPVKTEAPPSISFPSGFELNYITELPKDNETQETASMCDFLAGIETLEAQRHSQETMSIEVFGSEFQGMANVSYDISIPSGNQHASNILQDWTPLVPPLNMTSIIHPSTIFSTTPTLETDGLIPSPSINENLIPTKLTHFIPLNELKDKSVEGSRIVESGMKHDPPISKPSTILVQRTDPLFRAESIINGLPFTNFPMQHHYQASAVNFQRFSHVPTSTAFDFSHKWGNLDLVNQRASGAFQDHQNTVKLFTTKLNTGSSNRSARSKYIVEVIVPPPRKDLPLDDDPGISDSTTTVKEENVDELMHLLTPFVNKDWGLGHVDHIPKFVKIMRNEAQSLRRSLLLTVLVNTTDRTTLKRFSNSKGPTVLRLWIIQAQKENNLLLIKLLEALKNIPMDIDTLKETMLGRVIKTLKHSEHEDVRKLAAELMDRWTKLVRQEAINPVKKRSDNFEDNTQKQVNTCSVEVVQKKARLDKLSSAAMSTSSKPPDSNIFKGVKPLRPLKAYESENVKKRTARMGGINFFDKLSGSPLPKINKVRSSNILKPGAQSSSKSKSGIFSPLDALLPTILSKNGKNLKRKNECRHKIYLATSGILEPHPSTRPDSESIIRPGTKKKRVSFAPDHSLIQIREFKTEIEELSMSVTKEWERPKEILLDFSILSRGENSTEISNQQGRKNKALSVLYFSESQVPDTPHEPDEYLFEDLTYQVKVIPLYDIGSEAFQLSQMLSQVQATGTISTSSLPAKKDVDFKSATKYCNHLSISTTLAWRPGSTLCTQDPLYDTNSPGPGIPIVPHSNPHTSQYKSEYQYQPNDDEEEQYDPCQHYTQDTQAKDDQTYQSYVKNYGAYSDNESNEQWEYKLDYEGGDRIRRFDPTKKHYRRGQGHRRGDPNRNSNQWGSSKDALTSNLRTASAPCKFYAEGNCRYGEKCRFLHDFGKGRR